MLKRNYIINQLKIIINIIYKIIKVKVNKFNKSIKRDVL